MIFECCIFVVSFEDVNKMQCYVIASGDKKYNEVQVQNKFDFVFHLLEQQQQASWQTSLDHELFA